MIGRILSYNTLTGDGVISGEDGTRYNFPGTQWQSDPRKLRAGEQVDFQASGDTATHIYATSPAYSSGAEGEKSPIVAGLLALFLGGLGVHKFYLGYNSAGITLLASTVISWVLTIILIGALGLTVIGIICLIEAIIYLTKSQDEFTRTYVEGSRPWF